MDEIEQNIQNHETEIRDLLNQLSDYRADAVFRMILKLTELGKLAPLSNIQGNLERSLSRFEDYLTTLLNALESREYSTESLEDDKKALSDLLKRYGFTSEACPLVVEKIDFLKTLNYL